MENIEYVLPGEIEKRSFAIIGEELKERGIVLPPEQEPVTKRVIHTSADFDYAKTMTYSPHAVQIAKELIAGGADIVTDTNMALAGINKKRLAEFGGTVHCFMADEDVAREAKTRHFLVSLSCLYTLTLAFWRSFLNVTLPKIGRAHV